ncbi:MAG: ROK family transcriptional regulator [Acidobacteriota bacterium]|nr:ROK family transcriptional regulator [Acidobacteriota bacterium]
MRRINLKTANVARANTIRDVNRQIVLNYVRERGPISRAEISRETALQRSTVSLIVDELKADGIIAEVCGESTGGRPPSLLSLWTVHAAAVGVDVGKRRTVVATGDLAGRVLEQEEFVTDRHPEKTIRQIVNCVGKLIRKNKSTIEGIGVSLPGLVNPKTGKLYISNFKWGDLSISDELKAGTGLPVIVDNDANAVALAELWFGRPEVGEVRDFIMVLVEEEGIGTGIVFDGQVYRGEGAAAGEFGHMTIGNGAPVACECGSRGCWEAFSSGRAALARYAKLSRGSNGRRNDNFGLLVDFALKGEGAARTALKETAHYLGVGIANLIQGLAPEVVIVGGPIVRAWPLIAADLKTSVDANICRRGLPSTRVIASTLGAQPAVMGALSLVLANKFSSVSLT